MRSDEDTLATAGIRKDLHIEAEGRVSIIIVIFVIVISLLDRYISVIDSSENAATGATAAALRSNLYQDSPANG